MAEAELVLFGGWREAVHALEPSAVRWWITPTLADSALASEARPGDRILIRGDSRDVERGDTDLDLLRWLLSAGIEVRREARLNLRAYLAVHPASRDRERHAHAWIGSADATLAGRGSGRNGTLEAMAGPFALSEPELAALDAVWNGAEMVEPRRLQAEVEELHREVDRAAHQRIRGARWLVRIEVELASARWTPPHARRAAVAHEFASDGRVDSAPDDDESSVPFLMARHPLRRDLVAFSRALRQRLRSDGLLTILPGPLGTNAYLVDASRAPELRGLLDRADERLLERFGRRFESSRAEVTASFAARVEAVLVRQTERIPSERGVAPTWTATREEAMRSFDAFVDGRPVGVRWALSVPVESNDDAYLAASAALQPALLDASPAQVDALVDDVLERSGFGAVEAADADG